MTDSPDLEVQFDSRVDDGQLQHDEQISKSDIHVGQGLLLMSMKVTTLID